MRFLPELSGNFMILLFTMRSWDCELTAQTRARSFCMSHSSCNEADFCGEGSGHFRLSGEQIWKLLCGVIGPISTPNDYLNTVLDDVVSLCRNYALTQLVQDKLKLVAIFFLWCMWNIVQSNKNIFTWIVRRAFNAIINRNKTELYLLYKF